MAINKGNILCLFGVKGGIGKSVLAMNLAGVCSNLNRRVLLIDADLYGGSIALALNKPVNKTIYNFVDDYNNLAKYNYDDYFQLGMYKGDIYKTRNLRNLTLMQMYPDPDDLKHAQDSIEARLRAFDRNLWVPTREELAERAALEEEARLKAEGKDEGVEVKDRGDVASDEVDEDEAVVAEPKNKRSSRNKKSEKKPEKKPKKKAKLNF